MQLVVTIVEAWQLAGQANMNPFVKVHCDEDLHTTDTQFGTNHPYFNAVRILVPSMTSSSLFCSDSFKFRFSNDVRADVLVRLQHAAHSAARPHSRHPRVHEGLISKLLAGHKLIGEFSMDLRTVYNQPGTHHSIIWNH